MLVGGGGVEEADPQVDEQEQAHHRRRPRPAQAETATATSAASARQAIGIIRSGTRVCRSPGQVLPEKW